MRTVHIAYEDEITGLLYRTEEEAMENEGKSAILFLDSRSAADLIKEARDNPNSDARKVFRVLHWMFPPGDDPLKSLSRWNTDYSVPAPPPAHDEEPIAPAFEPDPHGAVSPLAGSALSEWSGDQWTENAPEEPPAAAPDEGAAPTEPLRPAAPYRPVRK